MLLRASAALAPAHRQQRNNATTIPLPWRCVQKALLDLTDDVPMGLYECPRPYHRLLDGDTLKWCAGTGRFLFHKDTCCNTNVSFVYWAAHATMQPPWPLTRRPFARLQGIMEKLDALTTLPKNTPFRFYNANVATIHFSTVKGGR